MSLKNNWASLLCYITFVHHFVAICEFKLELWSRYAIFGSKSVIFLSCVTFKFDRWPRKTKGHLSYATSSFVHHFTAICELKLELKSTSKNERAPLLCYFKLCASFHRHMIKTWVKIAERLNRFWPLWPWPLTSDLDLLHGHHFCQW